MKYKLLLSVVFVSFLINKETLAIVTKSTGDVKYKNYLSNEFSNELKMGSQLYNNDLIVTDSDGFVKFSYLDDGTTIKIHHDSELYVRGQINKKSIIGSMLTSFDTDAHPITGGSAPAAPPITIL